MQEYETLKRLVAEAEEDVNKAIGGNKAAGTRVRKKMQEVKAAAQEVRKKILEGRQAEPGAGLSDSQVLPGAGFAVNPDGGESRLD